MFGYKLLAEVGLGLRSCEYNVALRYKKLSCRSGTARRTMSVEILSAAAQLYEKSHLKNLQ